MILVEDYCLVVSLMRGSSGSYAKFVLFVRGAGERRRRCVVRQLNAELLNDPRWDR